MDARSLAATAVFALSLAAMPAGLAQAQMFAGSRMVGQGRASVVTANFVVTAVDNQTANSVAEAAELFREQLAIHWLGQPLPPWSQKCPIVVKVGERLGAGGATTFTLQNRTVGGWHMEVQGSLERVLDSVLPHEITHTVFATHFASLDKHLPRWADEGACSTVEFVGERQKHDHFLIQFLHEGRGLPFATMFALEEYPGDIMPLYAQGYSVTAFLIAQGGPRKFVGFLESGMRSDDWVAAVTEHYSYPTIGKLQNAWNNWVHDGGGTVTAYAGDTLYASRVASTADANPTMRLASAATSPAAWQDRGATAAATDAATDAAADAYIASAPRSTVDAAAATRFETTMIPSPRVTALPRSFESVGGTTIGPSVSVIR